jgi:membrane protein required for colicin V production
MNSVDFIAVLLMVVSIAIAVLRGFTREVLTIAAWLGAILAVLYGLPLIRPLMQRCFDSTTMADVAGGAGLFFITLIVLSLISNQIGKAVKKSGLGPVDRALGALFGAARGAVLLSLLYILIHSVAAAYLDGSKFAPMMEKGADFLKNIAPPEFAGMPLKDIDKKLEAPVAPDKPEENAIIDKPAPPLPGNPAAPPPPDKLPSQPLGYKGNQRGDLDHLIQNAEKPGSNKQDPTNPAAKP